MPGHAKNGRPATVSVVMATYQGERFLSTQLASIANQTRPPDELIISDDGSTDGTVSIARAFAESCPFPVRVLEGPRSGYADNFWQATEASSGDVIAWCDQDDVWLPTKLEACMEAMEQHDARLVTHSALLIDDRGRLIAPVRRRPSWRITPWIQVPDRRSTRVLDALEGDPWILTRGFTMVFDRDLVALVDWTERPLLHAHGGPNSHDGMLSLVAFATSRRVELAEPLARYRRHGDNVGGGVLAAGPRWARAKGVEPHQRLADCTWGYRRCFLDHLASGPAAAAYFERVARRASRWPPIYRSSSRIGAAARPMAAIASGAYGSRQRGRFRRLAVVKDLEHVVRRRSGWSWPPDRSTLSPPLRRRASGVNGRILQRGLTSSLRSW